MIPNTIKYKPATGRRLAKVTVKVGGKRVHVMPIMHNDPPRAVDLRLAAQVGLLRAGHDIHTGSGVPWAILPSGPNAWVFGPVTHQDLSFVA